MALKMMKDQQLQDDLAEVEKEIMLLKTLQHENVVKLLGYGTDGVVKKANGKIQNIVFLKLEFAEGGLLFDLCQQLGSMGEERGRYFMGQMLSVLKFMHDQNCVHRDLKLENILLDKELNMKVADFGFATFTKIHKLQTQKGSPVYMAPEIHKGQ